ncbi:hypothetical protein Hanom_Chr02g00153151 [Helianthus anomalus]
MSAYKRKGSLLANRHIIHSTCIAFILHHLVTYSKIPSLRISVCFFSPFCLSTADVAAQNILLLLNPSIMTRTRLDPDQNNPFLNRPAVTQTRYNLNPF